MKTTEVTTVYAFATDDHFAACGDTEESACADLDRCPHDVRGLFETEEPRRMVVTFEGGTAVRWDLAD